MKALVLAEHTDAARELAAGARIKADEVVLVVLGSSALPENSADFAANVVAPEGVALDCAAESLVAFADGQGFGAVFVEPTRRLKIVAGKIAAHFGVSVITDVLSFDAEGAKSMYFGGVAERVQVPSGDIAVYTVAGGVFAGAEASGSNSPISVDWVDPSVKVAVLDQKPVEKSGVDLTKADVVVAAGRGFAAEEDLDLARALCDKLNAGLGCSRPLTEGVNWLPSETYIGVSGLMASPKVYVAAGISGQMQHMVGCNRSDVVFAINKDKNAPVFDQCDYGLIGDLKTVLPAIVEAL